ncbi:MAG: SMP-30/gluconolactonase/LRE family protein [Ignavibacteriaceae bacterium]
MKKLFFLILLFFTSIIVAQSPVPSTTKLEKIADGLLQPEGPVWIDSLGLLFSDIKANSVYLWLPADSSLTTYIQPSDSCNGLTLDLQGRLILTQMKLRRVARRENDGTIVSLASTYEGKKFNSPNDVVVKSDGSIFFTDPDFNIPYPFDHDMDFQGIYRLDTSGTLKLLDKTLEEPNGICFSPDETKLYVNESHECEIYVWDVINDSTIANKNLLYSIPASGYADGMKTDPDGNIYCAGPTGVWIISPEGQYLDKIEVSGNPSNCAWGDQDRKALYITGGSSLYRIRLATTTDLKVTRELPAKFFKLYPNYPNPFNPETNITFYLGQKSHAELKIYNLLGVEVQTLVDKDLEQGNYAYRFNGKGHCSGIYFYQLTAGNFKEQKKMVLVK